jgi:hypothetical protein
MFQGIPQRPRAPNPFHHYPFLFLPGRKPYISFEGMFQNGEFHSICQGKELSVYLASSNDPELFHP